jgi:AcrR family transcriptional regulator/DNA-binding MarR family transcriptional regulator
MPSAIRVSPGNKAGTAVDVDRGGGRSGVAEIQRARMIAALVEVAQERGVGGMTVADIVARSGVSRRTFYELFADRDACFLAAFDMAVEQAAQRVLPAYGASGAWRERIRAGLGALLEFLEDEPGMGALCVVDALGAGPKAIERRAAVMNALIDAVHEGRHEVRGSACPTQLTAEGVVGAVLAVLHARLSAGAGGNVSRARLTADASENAPRAMVTTDDSENAPRAMPTADGGGSVSSALLAPLMGMIVLPYQGQAAAAREASRPAPQRRHAAHTRGDPLRELDMRLTYRTVRVLLAIAGLPGASNRQVADASGVVDQGQISKLLARLEHLGLIHNTGVGPARGEPNVWSLTAKGEEVERTIRQQTVR